LSERLVSVVLKTQLVLPIHLVVRDGNSWCAACRMQEDRVTGLSIYEGIEHPTATRLKARGADDRFLAQLMGHGDTRSVEKSAKLDSHAIRAGLGRLPSWKGPDD
jgi:hypothetical protein